MLDIVIEFKKSFDGIFSDPITDLAGLKFGFSDEIGVDHMEFIIALIRAEDVAIVGLIIVGRDHQETAANLASETALLDGFDSLGVEMLLVC
jgi:hypothetical protein